MWLTIAIFFGGLIYTISSVFKASSGGDHSADMAQAITNVTVVNIMLILVLGVTGYFYTQQYPTAREPYIMAMLHLSLLLSVISVSVASLFSVSN